MDKLEGEIALITGANSGIDLATAKQFMNEGAHVFIVIRVIDTGHTDTDDTTAVANESFALRLPTRYLPELEAAVGDLRTVGLKAAARLLLAAAPAVNVPLSPSWEQLLHQIAG
jgi:NAD(P)-dependent dehydrogenase (short-subunit alcohol dehydrogenase family)